MNRRETRNRGAKQKAQAREQAYVDAMRMFLGSLDSFLSLSIRGMEPSEKLCAEVPEWVRKCSRLVGGSLLAGPNNKLGDGTFSPYRLGYAVGLTQWGAESMNRPTLRPLKRNTASTRRAVEALLSDLATKHGLNPPPDRKQGEDDLTHARKVQRQLEQGGGLDAAEYHRGMWDGIRGLGEGAPGDRSNPATDIHLTLAIWWRYVETFKSVTELHAWLTLVLGARRAGEKKRIEKICERIGLTFRAPGRPRKSMIVHAHSDESGAANNRSPKGTI